MAWSLIKTTICCLVGTYIYIYINQSTSPNNQGSLDIARWNYWLWCYNSGKSCLLLFKCQYSPDISRILHGIKVFKNIVHTKRATELYITSWYISSVEPRAGLSQLRIGQVLGDMKLVAIYVPWQTPAHLLTTLKILDVVRKIQSSWQWSVSTNLAAV